MLIVPVVQGGMQWVGYAELAAAVSNAGGLGIVRLHFAGSIRSYLPLTLSLRETVESLLMENYTG